MVIPAESPDKKFVLLVGASHLRAIVDGIVKTPEGRFSFSAMSTPGACATQLRTEAANAVLPRTPDAVYVMDTSNYLTSSRTITEAGVYFAKLLATACVKYSTIAEYFPLNELDLWSTDGVHFSDSAGSPILLSSIWNAAFMQLVPVELKPSVFPRRSSPAKRVTPMVIVKAEVAKPPQLDPSKWTVIGQGRKCNVGKDGQN
ncbi:uncharacterized protein LOC134880413 [Eleginops maclovinus]|uniref:uncharacterized protein LOC134880413 n=1 Tax=Eleginops maclovinus TaxID=56733 RepID=UPI00308030E1